MGVDAESFRQLATSPEVAAATAELLSQAAGRTIFLGVDRLDYTKGIPRRLLAFEALLRDTPELRDRVRLVQVAVPSREAVSSYQNFRKEVEELIGRINGSYGTLSAVPIHYLYQSVPPEQLVALYRAADVLLVTPLRDGMNLVAKEYVASRVDEDGVLILSEFAGAIDELQDAVCVNAYDVEALTSSMRQALEMPPAERQRRMRAMRRRVTTYDVHRWAKHFVRALSEHPSAEHRSMPETTLRETVARLRGNSPLAILLDYDGTLVPIARTPDEARPDAELMRLIAALVERPQTMVLLVSGRARDTLESWFGHLRIEIWGEHGVWHKAVGATAWQSALTVPCCDWLGDVRAMMDDFAAATPGTVVEVKSSSVAWHYRLAGRGFGRAQARELRLALSRRLVDCAAEVMEGKRVVEVRPRGANKGAVVQHLLARQPAPAAMVAFGDDRTDEEMFAALPRNAVGIHVGPGASLARYRLRHPAAVRAFLTALLD
jgi:trehalose 6-phosphate synthase/phosphatase